MIAEKTLEQLENDHHLAGDELRRARDRYYRVAFIPPTGVYSPSQGKTLYPDPVTRREFIERLDAVVQAHINVLLLAIECQRLRFGAPDKWLIDMSHEAVAVLRQSASKRHEFVKRRWR